MLLLALIVFGICGILFSTITKNRSILILVLSAIAIGLFSLPSLILCFVLACINYLFIKSIPKNKWLFSVSIGFNVVSLFAFHLYERFNEEWAVLPIIFGVTYLILQFIDYAGKVRFKIVNAPASFIRYTSSVLYAPKFFMGPIASLSDIEKEINKPRKCFDKLNMTERSQSEPVEDQAGYTYYGLNRILLGLFKKLVLAESLSLYVSSALDFKDNYPAITILSGACLYALQLYFDFSGYCDIAIGASSLWNIKLPENFNFPFQQKTWDSFWKSWHSSLTNWLWQYVFMPLYLFFSRKKVRKLFTQSLCVLLVFTAMAFFNGIKSGFFISAGLYAMFYIFSLFFKTKIPYASVFMFFLFSVGLLFFRTPNYSNYSFLAERLTDFKNFIPTEWTRLYFAPLASGGTQQDYFNLSFTLVLCFGFLFFERKVTSVFTQNKIHVGYWFAAMLLIALWGVFTSGSRFIYMQF